MPQFDRVYRLVVGTSANALEITQNRVAFEIVKTKKKNPNRSKIRIWNLQPSTRAMLEKPDTRCQFWAGYSEQGGPLLVFTGSVTYAWSRHEKADWITELELGDGVIEYRDTMVSVGYSEAVDSLTILRDISQRMGLPLMLSDDIVTRSWAHGFSYYGPARSALDKATRGTGLEWSIQNGVLQVINGGGTTSRKALVFAADSGLVGTPERQREGARERATVTDQPTQTRRRLTSSTRQRAGWKFDVLLVGSITPGDRILLESRTIKGAFVVDEVAHKGDTHQGDWQSEITVLDKERPATPRTGAGTRRRQR